MKEIIGRSPNKDQGNQQSHATRFAPHDEKLEGGTYAEQQVQPVMFQSSETCSLGNRNDLITILNMFSNTASYSLFFAFFLKRRVHVGGASRATHSDASGCWLLSLQMLFHLIMINRLDWSKLFCLLLIQIHNCQMTLHQYLKDLM